MPFVALIDDDLVLAHWLADLAAEIALPLFEQGVSSKTKADGTIVTAADIEVERQLVAALISQRPEDGILSEEGAHRAGAGRRWILDPIDGTVQFAAGEPGWGTHVALEVSGQVVLGVITRPLQGTRWWSRRGQGAFQGSSMADTTTAVALRVSSIGSLAESRVTIWPPDSSPQEQVLKDAGIWIDAGLSAMDRLFSGQQEAVITYGGGPWDHAPAVVIVEEAGGRFRDPVGGKRIDLGGGTYSNGRIDDELERY